MQTRDPIADCKNILKQYQKFLLVPSIPLDGDSLGSALAMYLVLQKMGKQVTVVAVDPVPEIYKFLPQNSIIEDALDGSPDFIVTLDCRAAKVKNIKYTIEEGKVNIIVTPESGMFDKEKVSFSQGQSKYDAILTFDAGDPSQFGSLYTDNIDFFYSTPVINIDHHASNAHFGKINIVDLAAASTTQIVYKLILELGKELMDSDIATLLLAGLITDTGSFQHTNTTPQALEIAAALVEFGARQQEIVKNVYKTRKFSQLKLWGRVLTKMRYDKEHRILWATISQADFEATQSKPEDTGDLIDELLSNAPDSDIILLLKEKKPGFISGSLRSTTPAVNVAKIAEQFGGGGHTQASGFRISGRTMDDMERSVLKVIQELQRERLNMQQQENLPPVAPLPNPPQAAKEPPMIVVLPKPAADGNAAKNVEEELKKAEEEAEGMF